MAQLSKLENNIKTRQENFKRQCDFFDQHSNFFLNPIEPKPLILHGWHFQF